VPARRGGLSRRGCARLLAGCDEVLDALHGEEGGDDGDQDGRGRELLPPP
jgi:hypothetical protein